MWPEVREGFLIVELGLRGENALQVDRTACAKALWQEKEVGTFTRLEEGHCAWRVANIGAGRGRQKLGCIGPSRPNWDFCSLRTMRSFLYVLKG